MEELLKSFSSQLSELYYFYSMKQRKIIEPIILDQKYFDTVYNNIVEKIGLLDSLNRQYKQKQEDHFLKTFMNILQKMGNDLILAQEAYKNIDLQAKRDDYYIQLAEELNFFKNQCFTLRDLLNKSEKQIVNFKNHSENAEAQLQYTKQSYQKKIKQCMALKSEIKELRKQIKMLSNPVKNSIFKYTSLPENPALAVDSNKKKINHSPLCEDKSIEAKGRILFTDDINKRSSISRTIDRVSMINSQRNNLSNSPVANGFCNNYKSIRRDLHSTNISFRNKIHQRHTSFAKESYDPLSND